MKKVIIIAGVAVGGYLLYRWYSSSALPVGCGEMPAHAPENVEARQRWVECRVGREPTQAEATANPQAYRDWINAARRELYGRRN
jgi:hypothetical protein